MNPTQTEKENRIETADKPAERFVHTNQEKKRSENRRRASQYMKDLNRRNAIGDMLYMVGFWVEYVGVCVRRKVSTVVRGIADTVLNLLLIVLRPILIGLITLIEDLASPFVRASAIYMSCLRSWRTAVPGRYAQPRHAIWPAASVSIRPFCGTLLPTYCPLWQRRRLWSLCAAVWACILC